MRINEQGRSMIEMLGVLAIVGVLSVGGIAGYSKAMNKFKTNKLIDQVNMISTNIRTLYSSQRNYKGLTNKVATQTGVVPSEMYDAKASDGVSTITNAFGGKVDIQAAATAGDSEGGAYVISVDGIPAASCISIATTDWGGDSGSGLVAMYVENGKDIDAVYTKLKDNSHGGNAGSNLAKPESAEYGLPFNISNANLACKSTGTVGIGWKYL